MGKPSKLLIINTFYAVARLGGYVLQWGRDQ
jgi:hypothetical protein